MTNDQHEDISSDYCQERVSVWQKRYEAILHRDRATVDIGIFVLKAVMVVNGGAVLALMAVIVQLEGRSGTIEALAGSAYIFSGGLMVAVLGAGLSYFYIVFLTKNELNQYHTTFPRPDESPPYKGPS